MHQNITRIKAVNEALKNLDQDFVYVGGAVTSLYANYVNEEDDIRPTDDVDVIVELASYRGYSDLDQKLTSIGFKNDIFSGVICRYQIQGIIVDVMPTDPSAIGFSNRWYPEGFKTAIKHQIDKDCTINIFTLPYFVASKWEAFKDRGNDIRTSTDFEDLIYLFENVDDIEDELKNSPAHLFDYLKSEFTEIIEQRRFEEGLTAHLSRDHRYIDENYIKALIRSAFSIDPPARGFSR